MKRIIFIILLIFLVTICYAAMVKSVNNSSKEMDLSKYHDVGNYKLRISNYGTLGSGDDVVPQYPSLEYPKGSGINYLYIGALWFGASKYRRNEYGQKLYWQDPDHQQTPGTTPAGYGAVVDTLVSVGLDGDADMYELLPAYNELEHHALGNQYYIYADYDTTMKYYDQAGIIDYDDDGDGQIDEDPIGQIGFPVDNDSIFCFTQSFDDDGDGLVDEDGGYFGQENLHSYFYDYSPFGTQPPADGRWWGGWNFGQVHTPLNIAIEQESFCWPEQYFDQISLIKTTVYNTNELDTLFDFTLGYLMDCDVGPQSWGISIAADDVSSYISGSNYEFAYSYDSDHDGGLSEGYVASKVFPINDDAEFTCWTWSVGNGPRDEDPNTQDGRNQKYWLMTNRNPDENKFTSLKDYPNSQINDPVDTRFMYSIHGDQQGYNNPTDYSLNLAPGDSVVIYSAVFMGDSVEELKNISTILEQFHDTNFDLDYINNYKIDLYFSEYIEGSGNNKALELYNPRSESISLDNYRIAQSVNGGGWEYWHYFPAGTNLAAGDVWVIAADEADQAILDVADETLSYPSVVHFNGNDAIGIKWSNDGGTTWNLTDVIGDPDEDPGVGWNVAGISDATYDHTLVRNDSIYNGNTNWNASAGTNSENSEWTVYSQDTFQYLGWQGGGGEVPETYISTSQGNIDSLRVGAAINFELSANPFAEYYKYRLVYYENLGTDTLNLGPFGDAIDSTDWHSTLDLANSDELLLKAQYENGNPYNKPILRANEKYADGTYEVTQLQVKAVNYAGMEDTTAANMTFFVRDYFYPETAPFMASWSSLPTSPNQEPVDLQTRLLNILPYVYLLGEYHYLNYLLPYAQNSEHPVPNIEVNGEYRFGNPLYVDINEEFSAIWSEDLQIHLWWSYLGEFVGRNENGIMYRDCADYTFAYDENLEYYIHYYCDMQYMDIQLDGGVNTLPSLGSVIVDSTSGEEWIRVPITQPQSCILTDLTIGEHTFKVRAVDMQGAVDQTPEELTFTLHAPLDANQSDNLLIIDDTRDRMFLAEEDSVDNFYQELVDDYSGTINGLDLLDGSLDYIRDLNRDVRLEHNIYFAPSDIQDNKLVLWHSNNPLDRFWDSYLNNHYTILRSYLDQQGSLLFTGTYDICDSYSDYKFLKNYGGLADTLSTLSQEMQHWWGSSDITVDNSMFLGAEGYDDFHSLDPLDLNQHLQLLPNNQYFPEWWITGPLGKLGNVTFLNPVEADTIFKCITDTMSSHQIYADAPVGTKYVKEPGETGAVYILGFPLYYIEMSDAKSFMNLLYADLDSLYAIDDPNFVQNGTSINIMSYPNPANSRKTFSFSINNKQNLVDPEIKIYNIKGQLVRTLKINPNNINQTKDGLSSSVQWNLKDNYNNHIANGIYFYRLKSTSLKSSVEKMIILH